MAKKKLGAPERLALFREILEDMDSLNTKLKNVSAVISPNGHTLYQIRQFVETDLKTAMIELLKAGRIEIKDE